MIPIAMPLAAALGLPPSLVLAAVFVPVMLMPGISGALYRQFAITISVAVVISSLNALTLSPGDRVSTVVDYILTSYQPDFAVVLGDRLLGVVTRKDVMQTLATRPDDPYVAEIMNREVVRVDAGDALDAVQQRMGSKGVRLVAVFSGDRYLGLVSREDLSEALQVLLFQRRQRAAATTA